ncbi:MAG: hypothetical protein EPN43_07075 [Jatrophihabitans sp.]|nr:MAG: hypothetical protein EPN43_07075 [Jatrophihabitans sp.]
MSDEQLPPEGPQPGGPVLEEAFRLAGAVRDWARATLPPPTGDPRADCQWCPLCQFAAVLRGERPDVNDRLTEAGAAIVGALRSLLDPAAGGAHHHPASPGGSQPRVQRIDLGDPGAADPETD